MTRDLTDFWKYDLWANRLWIDALLKFPDPKAPNEVMTHILWGQWLWLDRCNSFFDLGLDLPAKPEAPSSTLAEELNQLWISILDRVPSDKMLEYTNLAGQQISIRFADAAFHIANHGTYHRGHLRGMAEVQMVTDFPETDFSRWAVQSLAETKG